MKQLKGRIISLFVIFSLIFVIGIYLVLKFVIDDQISKSQLDFSDFTSIGLGMLGVFIIIFLLVSFVFIHHWISKMADGLSEIERVTQELNEENYGVRYKAHSYEEIDELGKSINQLAESLYHSMHQAQIHDDRLYELINNLVLGVMLIDNDRKILMTNPAMNEILGSNLYGEIDREYTEVIKSAEIVEIFETAYRRLKAKNKEIKIYYPDEKVLDVNVIPIPGSEDDEYNFIILLYDITEMRRLEKIRTDFATNVSHELRTPITALKGFSETLLDGAMYDEEVLKEFLLIMHKEARRLDMMVQDILQLSRLEQKETQINAEVIQVSDVAADVLQIMHQKVEIKNITCQIKAHDPVKVFVDRDQLKQILLNLVANALSYTRDGGKVSVIIQECDGEARIEVKDNGIGIPEEEQLRIFERFYRVDKARSRNVGGTGLGLSIVRWLVEGMSGRIEVESEYKKGSSFIIWLPLYEKSSTN